jgi:hypothetical protein
MSAPNQPTCGQGLAHHAQLPSKLAELIASLAENLELHMQTLDLNDESARAEHDVYAKLAADNRRLSAQLRATGEEMAAQRDLPMGRHDPQALSSPKLVGAFETFARLERQLLALLQERVEENERMLAQMRRTP